MAEHILDFLDKVGGVISLVGVFVIAGGFFLAAGRDLVGYRRLDSQGSFQHFKVGLGRALMLGLEILVVADVIETITIEPTFGSLAALGFLVLLRTLVSWTLTLDVEGRWPWQPARAE